MKRKMLVIGLLAAFMICLGYNEKAQASFGDVLNVINATGRTINTVNSAGRSTMSTIEFGQRFQDRQQDRQDRKRAEKSYNANAEAEYYRTLQETQELKRYGYNNNL